MKFGKRLRVEANLTWNTRWADYYMDYKSYKILINNLQLDNIHEVKRKVELLQNNEKHSLQKSKDEIGLKNIREVIAKRFIKAEYQKCTVFIQSTLQKEKRRLETLNEHTENIVKLKSVRNLDRLKVFVNFNTECLTKMLKKYNKKLVAKFDSLKPLDEYFKHGFDTLASYGATVDEIMSEWRTSMLEPSLDEVSQLETEDLDDIIVENQVPIFTSLNLDLIQPGTITRLKLELSRNGIGEPIAVPVVILKGKFTGPTLGITSALHGNELSGIPLLHNLLNRLNVQELAGTLIAVPILNPPGYLRKQREFFDGQDLNRLFPGKIDGNCGQVYTYNILNKLISKFEFHVDLHTASFGRVNSFYIRADMNNASSNRMAIEQCSQIVVHNTAPDGSLRSAAMELGIPSITLEIGDPQIIHKKFVQSATQGIENLLVWLNMIQRNVDDHIEDHPKPTICTRSYWIYAKTGGLLTIRPAVNQWIHKGEVYAQIKNVYGDVVATYRAPSDGIIVGKSTNPVCATGDRMIHFGVNEGTYELKVDDGHT